MIEALAVVGLVAGGLVVPAPAGEEPAVVVREEGGELRVWSAEVEGRVIARAAHCDQDTCDLLLVTASEIPVEDELERDGEDEPADSSEEAQESRGSAASPDGETKPAEGSESAPALIHLHLDSEGGRIRVVSPALPVLEGDEIALLDLTSPGGSPRAGLRLGQALWLVPFAGSDPAGSSLPARPVLRFEEGREALPLAPGSGWIGLLEPGLLELVELEPGGTVGERRELVLPFEVRRRGRSLTLESPSVDAFPGVPPTVVAGPQGSGSLRLRSLVFDPGSADAAADDPALGPSEGDAEGGESEEGSAAGGREMWSALPGPETVRDHEVVEVDGARYLIVSTTRADKLSMLERKKLRIWRLEPDRTRAGAPPLAEIRTASRHWQELRWSLVDATSDGILDLVLLQPEGLGGQKLAVDLYVGLPGGRFESRKIRSLVKNTPAIWRYGRDLTGDGVPDLLLASSRRVEVRSGRERPDRRGLLEEVPVAQWSSSLRVSGEVEGDRARRAVAVEGGLVVLSRRVRGRTALEVVAVDVSSMR